MLSMDLDDFKLINDSMGHAVGDAVLTAVAQRLLGCVGPATRWPGGRDEFLVVMEGGDDDSIRSRVGSPRLVEPFEVADEQLVVRPSVGLAVATGDDDARLSAEVLLDQADGRCAANGCATALCEPRHGMELLAATT